MEDSLFTKIINREISADIIYEDDLSLAFRDINPQAPFHALLIPKLQIPKLSESSINDQTLLGHLMLVAPEIARQHGHEHFRLVINNGEEAGQTVFHLHVHILAGRSLAWPPG